MFFISLIKSFRNAFRGLSSTIRRERNFRIHISTTILVTYFGSLYGLEKAEWVLLILIISAMLAVELFNTSIEETIDFFCSKKNDCAKRAKDVAAAGVLVPSIAAVVSAIMLFSDLDKLKNAFSLMFSYPRVFILVGILLFSIIFVLSFKKDCKEKKY